MWRRPVVPQHPPVLEWRAIGRKHPGNRPSWRRIGFHHAVRERDGETVMAAKKYSMDEAFSLPDPPADAEQRRALDNLFSLTYEELRRLAAAVRRGDPSATLSPTVLVHEAWLKLEKSPGISGVPRLHFKRIAARAMRQVLVEAARRRQADKRSHGAEITVIFDEAVHHKPSCTEEVLALHRALNVLAEMSPRQAVMVESRFFGGFDIPETAALLNISEATVLRDWRAAKAWLARELREAT